MTAPAVAEPSTSLVSQPAGESQAGAAPAEASPQPARESVGASVAAAAPATAHGAPLPGGSPWEGSHFFTQILQQNAERLRRDCPQLRFANTPREAINMAYSHLYEYLPLPVGSFVNFDFLKAFGATADAVEAVVAEKILRISDINRDHGKQCRVDIFVYRRDGVVTRHHPGKSRQQNMSPHTMPFGSGLFSLRDAQQTGVGAALHVRPPGRAPIAGAPQPGVALCTSVDVAAACEYDKRMWSWNGVRENILEERQEEDPLDISGGELFPWWLLVGGPGPAHRLLDSGISHVAVTGRSLLVTLLDGRQVTLGSGRWQKMQMREI